MRESEIQSYWHEQFETIGGLCRKVKAEVVNGFPDYLNVYMGRVFLIEFKAPGQQPRPHQTHEHNLWRDHAVPVLVVDSLEQCQELLSIVLQGRPFPHYALRPA
jgi:hypothetical protein